MLFINAICILITIIAMITAITLSKRALKNAELSKDLLKKHINENENILNLMDEYAKISLELDKIRMEYETLKHLYLAVDPNCDMEKVEKLIQDSINRMDKISQFYRDTVEALNNITNHIERG